MSQPLLETTSLHPLTPPINLGLGFSIYINTRVSIHDNNLVRFTYPQEVYISREQYHTYPLNNYLFNTNCVSGIVLLGWPKSSFGKTQKNFLANPIGLGDRSVNQKDRSLPRFHCRGRGFHPGWGTKIPHAARRGQKIKTKQKDRSLASWSLHSVENTMDYETYIRIQSNTH